MRRLIFFVALLFPYLSFSQGWMGAIKIESSNSISGNSIVTDNQGNPYVGLNFKTDCSINGSLTVNATGAQDGLIIKFKDNGDVAFIKHFKTTLKVNLSALEVDKEHNIIYATGGFSDTMFVDNDTLVAYNDGQLDGFLMKMDFSGNIMWVKRFCWGPNLERGVDIKIDHDGNLVLTGIFKDSVYIGDELGINNDAYYWQNATKDLFIAKYNSDGHIIFSKAISTSNNTDFINRIAINSTSYFFTGYFANTINIEGTNYLSAGGYDFLLLATDYFGNVQFVKNFGGASDDRLNDLAISNGELYVAGDFASSSVTVDGFVFGSNGGADIIIMKLDTLGNTQWVYTTGNSLTDLAAAISPLDTGVIVSGQFTDSVDFGGDVYYGDAGDAFGVSIFPDGSVVKFAQTFGNGADKARRNSVDLFSLNNNRYILGQFASDTLFVGTDSLINDFSGLTQVFVAKYGCPNTDITFEYNPLLCYGDSTTVVAKPNVGLAPFSYSWSTGDTIDTLYNVASGMYYLTVTDANGCIQIDSLFINQPAPLSAVLEVHNESCNGGDGHIDLTVSGGTPQYYYNWSTSDTIEDIDSLDAGMYVVTITDVNGCVLVDSAIVNPYDTITIVGNVTNESCHGADGAVVIGVTGGEPSYSYLWNTGDTSSEITGLVAGTYFVTVTDINGCTGVDSFTVLPYDTLNAVFETHNVTCNGNDGSITVAVNGGDAPFTYMWNNGETTSVINNLGEGWYVVTITDSRGCQVVDSTEVLPYVPMQVTYNVHEITCNGNDGSIEAVVSGGNLPYSYEWSTGDTVAGIDSLSEGMYYLTVTDHSGCQVVDSVEVVGFEPLAINFVVTNVSCAGNDGSVEAFVSGGNQPYSYSWNNGDDTSAIFNLIPGTYVLSVSDANGCVIVDSVEVMDYTPMQVISNVEAVSCHNNDGSVDLFVSGGAMPYSYEWNTGDTLQDLDSLSAGTYVYTITDARGCTLIDSVEISQQMPPVISLSASDILCAGDSTATISAHVEGENPPFTALWYSVGADTTFIDTAESIVNMPAGNYLVRIIDANNCEYFDSITVVEPDSIKLEFDVTPENCKNTNTGAIELTVSGGASGIYFYDWSTGATTKNLENLSTGTYYITVTDMNDCQVADSVFVPLTENDCNVDLVIYNLLTPNGDGQNDYWVIENIDVYPGAVVEIYNEWGNLVFSTDDYSEPWDGKDMNGKLVVAGTYYYIITLPNGTSYNGYLTVMY